MSVEHHQVKLLTYNYMALAFHSSKLDMILSTEVPKKDLAKLGVGVEGCCTKPNWLLRKILFP